MNKLGKKVMNELYNREDRENTVSLEINGQKVPDPKLHQQISFIKSGIRILGYAALWWSIDIAAILLILSEIVGIGEELV